jgi:hypothetical protein
LIIDSFVGTTVVDFTGSLSHRMRKTLVVIALLTAGNGCAHKPAHAGGQTGRLTVGVTTRGPAIAGLSFEVAIEPAAIQRRIRADAGVVSLSAVPAGDHRVRLTNVPARCRVDGPAERTVAVMSRGSATVRFSVVCE